MTVVYERENATEVYTIHEFKVLPFYAAYFLWQSIELTLIPFLLRKMGFFKARWTLKDWMINLPWLWGRRYVFPKGTHIELYEAMDDPIYRAYIRGLLSGS